MRRIGMLLIIGLALLGCDFHGHGTTYVVHKPEPVVSYSYVPPQETIVVIEEVYVCEPSYDPTPQFPYECVDYGVGVGSCCTYVYGDWDWTCEEEWCWWEDMCYWENTYSSCTSHY